MEKCPLMGVGGWGGITSWATTTHQANEREKKTCWSGWVRLRHNLTINCTPSMTTHNYKGTQNPEFLSEEQRVWTSHQVLHLRNEPPKHLVLKTSGAIHETTGYSKLKNVSLRANAPGLTHPGDQNRDSWMKGTQTLMWKRLICLS